MISESRLVGAVLSEAERRLLERLSVFSGGFTVEAAGEVCGFAHLTSDVVASLITSLADKSLIEVRQTNQGKQHYMLQTIRQFSVERLASRQVELFTAGLSPAYRNMVDYMGLRHAEYYLQLAEIMDPLLKGPDQAIWLRRMSLEADNVRVALNWCMKCEEFELGLRLAAELWRVFYMNAQFEEGYSYIRGFLDHSRANPSTLAKGTGAAGILAYQRADYINARKHFEDVIEIAEAIDRPLTKANAYANLGNIESFEGNFVRGEKLQLDGLAIYRKLGQGPGSAVFLSNLASNATRSQDSANAIRYSLEALAEYRELGDSSNVAILLENLAEAYMMENRNAEAVSCISEALELSDELQNWRVICECHSLLLTLSAADREWNTAANLAGMHRTLHSGLKLPLTSPELPKYVELRQEVEAAMGSERYRRALECGAQLEKEACITFMKELCAIAK
jgi:tetratricopeptide (TPR) repeat protein